MAYKVIKQNEPFPALSLPEKAPRFDGIAIISNLEELMRALLDFDAPVLAMSRRKDNTPEVVIFQDTEHSIEHIIEVLLRYEIYEALPLDCSTKQIIINET